MTSELARQIAKAIKQHEGWHDDDDESDIARIIEQHVAPLVEFADAAKSYIHTRNYRPHAGAGAFFDLCAAEEKLKESRT